MKTLKVISLLCIGILVLGGYSIVLAAEDSDVETSNVTLTINPVCRLVISNSNVTKTLLSDAEAEAAFDAGYIDLDADAPNLKVSANKSWKLTTLSSGFADNAGYIKDIGDLQLKDAGLAHVTMASFTSLSAVDQEVGSHTAGVKNEDHPCQYRILLDYTKDIAGDYSATVTYTLATQP